MEFSEYILRDEIVESYGTSVLNFLKVLQTDFQNSYVSLHFCQVPIFPHPFQHLLSNFLIIAFLTKVRCYLIVVLIYITLMTRDVEHF